jgi:hypothetical protein
MITQVMMYVLSEVLCLMRQTRVVSYSIDATCTYVVVMEQWSNFTLHFGCIGVHEHIEKGQSYFKFEDPVSIIARRPCINNRNTTLY